MEQILKQRTDTSKSIEVRPTSGANSNIDMQLKFNS